VKSNSIEKFTCLRMPFTIEVIFLDYLLHGFQNVEDGRREVIKRVFPRMILDKEKFILELEGE
jgi:hypothetical protein